MKAATTAMEHTSPGVRQGEVVEPGIIYADGPGDHPVSRGYPSITLVGWASFGMMARPMNDEKAKTMAQSLVEEALRESSRDDATINRVYLIPDRDLYVVIVVVEGNKFRVSFPFAELTGNQGTARQMARIFVTDGLPKRTR